MRPSQSVYAVPGTDKVIQIARYEDQHIRVNMRDQKGTPPQVIFSQHIKSIETDQVIVKLSMQSALCHIYGSDDTNRPRCSAEQATDFRKEILRHV